MKSLTRFIFRYQGILVIAILTITTFSFNKLLGDIHFQFFVQEIYLRCGSCDDNFPGDNVDGHWLAVANRKTVAYSAFLEMGQNESVVRVLAIKRFTEFRPILCLLWTCDKDQASWKMTVTKSSRDLINVPPCISTNNMFDFCFRLNYEAYYLDCHLPANVSFNQNVTKYSVSLIDQESYNEFSTCSDYLYMPKLSINLVYEHNNHDLQERSSSVLAVCISPVFDWDNIPLTKLFLEHYLSQGFTKFVFYKRSWSSNIENIFNSEHYKKHIQIIQWPLMPNVSYANLNVNTSVRYRGQILAMNDCLWRQRMDARIRFVAFVDLDEYLSPVTNTSKHLSLSDILFDYDRPDIGSFAIENRFMTFDLENPHNVHIDEYIFAYSERSKLIVKPGTVEKLTVHLVWRHAKGYQNQVLSSDVAILNHYRPSVEKFEHFNTKVHQKNLSEIFPKLTTRFDYIFNNSKT